MFLSVSATRSSSALWANTQLSDVFSVQGLFGHIYPVVKHPIYINKYIVMSQLHSILRTIDASYCILHGHIKSAARAVFVIQHNAVRPFCIAST